MSQDANSKHNLLYQWYAIKPLAAKIFYQYAFEIYWIKNAWMCFYEGIEDEELRKSITFGEKVWEPKEEVSDEVKVWLVALYKLYHAFKKVIDLEYEYDIEVNEVADRIDFGIRSYYKSQLRRQNRDKEWNDEELAEFIWEDLRSKEEVFIKIIKRKFNDDSIEMAGFFCNAGEALDLPSYLKANEDQCNSLEEFLEIEEKEYSEYQNKIEVDHPLDSNFINFEDPVLGAVIPGQMMAIFEWIENGFSN